MLLLATSYDLALKGAVASGIMAPFNDGMVEQAVPMVAFVIGADGPKATLMVILFPAG